MLFLANLYSKMVLKWAILVDSAKGKSRFTRFVYYAIMNPLSHVSRFIDFSNSQNPLNTYFEN